jgi:hypothetical protein
MPSTQNQADAIGATQLYRLVAYMSSVPLPRGPGLRESESLDSAATANATDACIQTCVTATMLLAPPAYRNCVHGNVSLTYQRRVGEEGSKEAKMNLFKSRSIAMYAMAASGSHTCSAIHPASQQCTAVSHTGYVGNSLSPEMATCKDCRVNVVNAR